MELNLVTQQYFWREDARILLGKADLEMKETELVIQKIRSYFGEEDMHVKTIFEILLGFFAAYKTVYAQLQREMESKGGTRRRATVC